MTIGQAPASGYSKDHLVAYRDLRPCRTAFIDTKTPGSHLKENFTIIGPGVAENPDQHVHISRPHGFNIGGARQPPGCTNSQHFHETAEVFFIHSGTWAFRSGENADEGEVILGPGEVISIPVHIFRGFENVGEDVGFLYAVLGGDDPGRVTWAPRVLEAARGHGLILAESGRLIDTTKGDQLRPGEIETKPLSRDALAAVVRHATSADLRRIVATRADQDGLTARALGTRAFARTIIGGAEADTEPPLAWPHGFACQVIDLEPGGVIGSHQCAVEDVWFLHRGGLEVRVNGEVMVLGPGDVLSIPVGAPRDMRAVADGPTIAFVTTRGDQPPSRTMERGAP